MQMSREELSTRTNKELPSVTVACGRRLRLNQASGSRNGCDEVFRFRESFHIPCGILVNRVNISIVLFTEVSPCWLARICSSSYLVRRQKNRGHECELNKSSYLRHGQPIAKINATQTRRSAPILYVNNRMFCCERLTG